MDFELVKIKVLKAFPFCFSAGARSEFQEIVNFLLSIEVVN